MSTTPTITISPEAREAAELEALPHLEYEGGGYYRDSRVPKGETALIVHGPRLLELCRNQLTELLKVAEGLASIIEIHPPENHHNHHDCSVCKTLTTLTTFKQKYNL